MVVSREDGEIFIERRGACVCKIKKVKYQKSKYQVEFHIFMNNIEK